MHFPPDHCSAIGICKSITSDRSANPVRSGRCFIAKLKNTDAKYAFHGRYARSVHRGFGKDISGGKWLWGGHGHRVEMAPLGPLLQAKGFRVVTMLSTYLYILFAFLFSTLRLWRGCWKDVGFCIRRGKVLRFVSESLPRLISDVNGSEPLPQTLVVITTR